MATMTTTRRRLATMLTALLMAALTACGESGPAVMGSPAVPSVGPAAGSGTPDASSQPAPATAQPVLTPVPGGTTPEAVDPGTGTTITDWGRILDRVPDGFPVYPGAASTGEVNEPVSGAWLADAGPAAVAGWYVGRFEELGWSSIDLGSALEDGTRVLDLASDLPECRVQTTFRPAGGSTMILVLYGAGCAGGDA